MDRLKGKVAVVTGGGGGIGSATCRRFAEEGAKVAVLDIDLESAQAVAASIPDSDTLALRVDITNLENVEQSIEQTEQQLGSVDILINNAGWDVFRPFLKTNPTFWRKVIYINLVGVLNMHHVVLPGMVKRGYGRVVSVSSDAGRVGSSGESGYAACKAGMIGFARTLAREHARQGITFNVVCPGPTETALFSSYSEGAGDPEKLRNAMQRAVPMGRIGTPDDLPGAIAFLASDDAA